VHHELIIHQLPL